jgi:hypothetical protein
MLLIVLRRVSIANSAKTSNSIQEVAIVASIGKYSKWGYHTNIDFICEKIGLLISLFVQITKGKLVWEIGFPLEDGSMVCRTETNSNNIFEGGFDRLEILI